MYEQEDARHGVCPDFDRCCKLTKAVVGLDEAAEARQILRGWAYGQPVPECMRSEESTWPHLINAVGVCCNKSGPDWGTDSRYVPERPAVYQKNQRRVA